MYLLKGWGFEILCTEKDKTAIFGTFMFTSNIPNEYNVRGQKGVVIFALNCLLYRIELWLEDLCCSGCRKQTLQFNTSCCYLVGKNTLVSDPRGSRVAATEKQILYDNRKSWNQKITVGESDVSVCWNFLEPLDTHRKAIDCRSSTVHVIYCLSSVFNYYYLFSKCFNCLKWFKINKKQQYV